MGITRWGKKPEMRTNLTAFRDMLLPEHESMRTMKGDIRDRTACENHHPRPFATGPSSFSSVCAGSRRDRTRCHWDAATLVGQRSPGAYDLLSSSDPHPEGDRHSPAAGGAAARSER